MMSLICFFVVMVCIFAYNKLDKWEKSIKNRRWNDMHQAQRRLEYLYIFFFFEEETKYLDNMTAAGRHNYSAYDNWDSLANAALVRAIEKQREDGWPIVTDKIMWLPPSAQEWQRKDAIEETKWPANILVQKKMVVNYADWKMKTGFSFKDYLLDMDDDTLNSLDGEIINGEDISKVSFDDIRQTHFRIQSPTVGDTEWWERPIPKEPSEDHAGSYMRERMIGHFYNRMGRFSHYPPCPTSYNYRRYGTWSVNDEVNHS